MSELFPGGERATEWIVGIASTAVYVALSKIRARLRDCVTGKLQVSVTELILNGVVLFSVDRGAPAPL